MRVVAIVESTEHVCARYRIRAFCQPLARHDINLQIISLPKGIPGRQKMLWGLKGCRVILLRKLLSWVDWRIIRSRASWVGFDFDDAVYLRDSYSGKGFEDPRRTARFRRIVEEADAVIGGNKHLAQKALTHGAKGLVKVIPTCVDTGSYIPVYDQNDRDQMTLVWIGSSSTLQGLERLRVTLEDLGRAVPGIELKLICDRFLRFDHLATINCSWSESTEAGELASADVGISWIPDDPWSQGKCGLKLIQCMAAGLPVIANPVGVHPEMVTQGENGFLANSTSEWISAVTQLKYEKKTRRMMGTNGRKMVENAYSIEAGTKAWLEILK